jgi:hypothetical protein
MDEKLSYVIKDIDKRIGHRGFTAVTKELKASTQLICRHIYYYGAYKRSSNNIKL